MMSHTDDSWLKFYPNMHLRFDNSIRCEQKNRWVMRPETGSGDEYFWSSDS